MTKKVLIAIGLLILLLAMGCCIYQQRTPEDDLFAKAAELKKLSASVESSARYKNISPDLKDEELLVEATKHNPALLNGFEDYTLRAVVVNKHALLLLCDDGGKQALVEDSGCTGEVDAHLWQNETPLPCEFTLDVNTICIN